MGLGREYIFSYFISVEGVLYDCMTLEKKNQTFFWGKKEQSFSILDQKGP